MLTLIVGMNFAAGNNWLRQNHKRLNLDSQRCRIVTEPHCFTGLNDYEVYWISGWEKGRNAAAIRQEALIARGLGRLKKDHAA